jgi:hypothetical protein
MSTASPSTTAATRPLVGALFVASCLLSIVSWYTTEQGMALYLATWFAVIASVGIQSALVIVAWLTGFTRRRRGLLIAVYAMTALVSIGFSYSSLYTWFSARERPATIQRRLYDKLNQAAAKAEEQLASAIAEGQKHVVALDEMTEAEKAHGFISRSQDPDAYLAKVRESVAREAQTYSNAYREGAGAGLRYTAFERYAKLARHSVETMQQSEQALARFRGAVRPLDSSEKQLRDFHQAYDTIPWPEVEQALHTGKVQISEVPAYADFVDHTATGQEDLRVAFEELVTQPTSRHLFAFLLAAFIDVVVFLLAFAAGPYFFGTAEERWVTSAATLDGTAPQIFARDFLRKLEPSPQGMPRADAANLTAGELQLCLVLESKGLAASTQAEGRLSYLLDAEIHEHLIESLANPGMRLRATVKPAMEV